MEGGGKSLVLFYHVFNATDKDAKDIHDWERVEILVRGVTGAPGAGGEYVNHVAATGTRRPTAGSTGAGCNSSATGPATEAPPPVVCSPSAQLQCEINGGTWKPATCSCKALCSGCQIP